MGASGWGRGWGLDGGVGGGVGGRFRVGGYRCPEARLPREKVGVCPWVRSALEPAFAASAPTCIGAAPHPRIATVRRLARSAAASRRRLQVVATPEDDLTREFSVGHRMALDTDSSVYASTNGTTRIAPSDDRSRGCWRRRRLQRGSWQRRLQTMCCGCCLGSDPRAADDEDDRGDHGEEYEALRPAQSPALSHPHRRQTRPKTNKNGHLGTHLDFITCLPQTQHFPTSRTRPLSEAPRRAMSKKPKTSFKQMLASSSSNPLVNLQGVRQARQKVSELKRPAAALGGGAATARPSAKRPAPASAPVAAASAPQATAAAPSLPPPPRPAPPSTFNFLPANTFQGKRLGYAYKTVCRTPISAICQTPFLPYVRNLIPQKEEKDIESPNPPFS